MMIICFIRSDDTEGWNKNCSNTLPAPLQVPRCPPEGRGCPTAPAECELQSHSTGTHRAALEHPLCLRLAPDRAASTGMGSPCSSPAGAEPAWLSERQNPAPHIPTELLPCPDTGQELSYPFLEACIEQNCTSCATSVSNSCQQSKNTEIFTYLLHKTDVSSRHFRTHTATRSGKTALVQAKKSTLLHTIHDVLQMSLGLRGDAAMPHLKQGH